MLRNLYARTLALAASPRAPWWLAAVAFAEASCFPVPPDVLLLLMGLARPRRAFEYAAIATVASVAGGALGYAIGYFIFIQVMQTGIAHLLFGNDPLGAFQRWYARWGLYVILIKGLTPIPYKLVTIASGAAKFNFWIFMGASLVTRGARFFLVATVLRFFGATARDFIERWLMLVTSALAVGIVGGFVLVRLM
ncbi:MAG TPA: YqaA family protein [Acetobacteraceae bacterium]|jgi:membrane protein YqaA with SNARE-associated domain|nr:YqaA family protein [Acetobacteraceae bacterium]